MDRESDKLPDVYFDEDFEPHDAPQDDVEAEVDDQDDDEELAETPPEVVELLGFDPLEDDAD